MCLSDPEAQTRELRFKMPAQIFICAILITLDDEYRVTQRKSLNLLMVAYHFSR